jgi:arylsulfatase A-like enzyme
MLAGIGVAPLPGANVPARAAATLPNIVLILVDDQPATMLNYMPNLQHDLVGQGVSFSRAYSGNPLCCPARTSILRGQYSHYTRLYGVAGTYGGAVKMKTFGLLGESLPVWLDRVGYRTALIGKYANTYSPTFALANKTPPGWDVWRAWMTQGAKVDGGYYNYAVAQGSKNALPVRKDFGSAPRDYSTRVYTNNAVSFVGSTPLTAPLFLHLDYHAPHVPLTVDPLDATAPCGVHPQGPAFGEADVSDKPTFISTLPWDATMASQAKQRWIKRCRMMISVVGGSGRVKAALDARDPGLDNTIVIYTSDQGIAEGEHRWTSKKVAYEESARVPLLVRYDPLTDPGTSDSRLVSLVDITATAVDLAGASVPAILPCVAPCIQGPMEGRSIVPLLTDPTAPGRDAVLIEHFDEPGVSGFTPAYCAIVTQTMKYIRYDPDLEPRNEELYDLVADPYELQNRAYGAAYATQKAALLARTKQLCSPTPVNYQFSG